MKVARMVRAGVVLVEAKRLTPFDPLSRTLWTAVAVPPEMVHAAVQEQRLRSRPIRYGSQAWRSTKVHAERVAYFFVNGIPEGEAVEIDVGVPSLGCHVIGPPRTVTTALLEPFFAETAPSPALSVAM